MPQFKSEESVFNMAMAYLKRIDKLLSLCAIYSMKGDIDNWTSTLRAVYREISIKLIKAEDEDIRGTDKEFDVTHIKPIDVTLNNINTLYNDLRMRKKYRKELLFLLDQVEIKMRQVMQKKNMLLPSRADPRFAVLER